MILKAWRHGLAAGVLVALGLLSVTGGSESFVQGQPPCTVTVKPGESIQKAIDAAAEGAVICLSAGMWQENIEIAKSLTLRGTGREQMVIKGEVEYKPVIEIGSDSEIKVGIEGLNVAEAKRSSGISVYGTAQVTISNFIISGNRMDGLLVRGSAQVSLTNSTVSGNGADGLLVWNSATVEIQNSTIWGNKGCGVWGSSKEARAQGTPNEMRDNGADLCGFAPASLRKPLVPQTGKAQLKFPEDFTSLQEAVDAIAPGGTIIVAAPHVGGLTIWKPLSLRGEGRGQTILSALPGRQVVVSVIAEAQMVVLEGLMVKGSQWGGLLLCGQTDLKNVHIFNNQYGLGVCGSAQVSLANSIVSSNERHGIAVHDSAQISLINSQIYGNGWDGFYIEDSATVEVRSSNIEGNGTSTKCTKDLWSCYGIRVFDSSQVAVIDSVIAGNANWGIGAGISKCNHFSGDMFTGKVVFEGTNIIEGNNRSGQLNGMGNPGNHPWNKPEVPDGQVCLP